MTYDWTPLWRSTIGFDRLFDVLDEVQRTAEESYPPYNIERFDENRFQISVALAGFTPEEVALTVEQNVLTLEGQKSEKEGRTFLHRGISARNFTRQFTLADHVEGKGARFENGLLVIELQREIPEAMKPRRIAINGAAPGNVTQIQARAAASASALHDDLPRGFFRAAPPTRLCEWRQPCGRRPHVTATSSTSKRSFIPAPSMRIRATWCPIRLSASRRNAPSWRHGRPTPRRSRPVRHCARRRA